MTVATSLLKRLKNRSKGDRESGLALLEIIIILPMIVIMAVLLINMLSLTASQVKDFNEFEAVGHELENYLVAHPGEPLPSYDGNSTNYNKYKNNNAKELKNLPEFKDKAKLTIIEISGKGFILCMDGLEDDSALTYESSKATTSSVKSCP